MSQGDVELRIGYAVKRVQAALAAAMDARLRGLGLGVSQYACLAQIDRVPGISNAELARAVFVSRQATHQLLGGLRASGLVDVHGAGRAQRLVLTPYGADVLGRASSLVAGVEDQMTDGLSAEDRDALRDRLLACADALEVSPAASEPRVSNPRP